MCDGGTVGCPLPSDQKIASPGRLAPGPGLIFVKRLHASLGGDVRAAGKHGIKQLLLILEVIVQQCMANFDALGDVLQSHAIESVLGEQVLGRVEYLLDRRGALFGVAGAAVGFQVLGQKPVIALFLGPALSQSDLNSNAVD